MKKKLLCLILCFVLLFNMVAVPASAAASLITLTSSGIGGIAAGSATVVSGGVAVAAFLAASGIVVYSLPKLAEAINTITLNLSAAVLSELQTLETQSVMNYSEAARQELIEQINQYFLDENGVFMTSSAVFDLNTLPVYDSRYSTNINNFFAQPHYEIGVNKPAVISGVPISISIVDNPFDNTNSFAQKYALEIVNTSTGAKLITHPTQLHSMRIDVPGHKFYTLGPTIHNSHKLASGLLSGAVGLQFVTEHCLQSDGTYCCVNQRYHMTQFSEANSTASGGSYDYYMFQGLGNELVDGVQFHNLVVDGTNTVAKAWQWIFTNAVGSVASIGSVASPIGSICAYPTKQALDTALDFPLTTDAVYNPTMTDARTDVGYFSKTTVRTGEKTAVGTPDVTVDPDNPGGSEPPGDEPDGILGWLKKIWEAIKSIPDAIINGIVAGISALFLPPEGYFDEYFKNLKNNFQDRMGILTYPMSLLYEFLDRLVKIEDSEPVLSWNSLVYQDTVLIEEGSFNLREFVNSDDAFKRVHDVYLIVVDAIVIFYFTSFIHRKYKSIISN